MPPTIHAVMLFPFFLALGCAGTPQTRPVRDLEPREHEAIALIDGQAITHAIIDQALYELAGREVLREYVLDRALEQRCKQSDIVITPAQIALERTLLAQTLVDGESGDARVLDALRRSRGLGPDRFERFVVRNAMLRALTSPISEPEPNAIESAMSQAFGARSRVRLCVSADADALGRLAQRVNASPPSARSVEFANACITLSTHPSADRGGLLPALSHSDPGYPQALLSAVQRTQVERCSPVVSTEAGYAVLLIESREPAIEPTTAQREQVLQQLRLDTQRIAMQRLAQQLLAEHEVIVLDRSLNWAWSNRP